MVSAMLSDAPSQFSMTPRSLLMSVSLEFIRARKPDMAFLPTSASAVSSAENPKRTGDRHTVLERLAHHANIGVRIGRSGCKNICKMPGICRRQTESCEGHP